MSDAGLGIVPVVAPTFVQIVAIDCGAAARFRPDQHVSCHTVVLPKRYGCLGANSSR